MTAPHAKHRISLIAVSLLMMLSFVMTSWGVPAVSAAVADVLQPVQHSEVPSTEANYGHKSAGRGERQPKALLIGGDGADGEDENPEARLATARVECTCFQLFPQPRAVSTYSLLKGHVRYVMPPNRAPPTQYTS